MAKSGLSQAENEALATQHADQRALAQLDPGHRDNFNIVEGKPLPEGFTNPPLGKAGHLCIDRAGAYRPDWCQVIIKQIYDHQQDPQPFPLGVTINVPLAEWCDVPPEVVHSLESAVETHHEFNATPEQINMGQHPEHKVTTIERFFWNHHESA